MAMQEQLLEYGDDEMSWLSDYQSSINHESVLGFEMNGVDAHASQAPEYMSSHPAAASGDSPGEEFSQVDHRSMYPMMYEAETGDQYTTRSLDDEDVGFLDIPQTNANLTAVGNPYAAQQKYTLEYAPSGMNPGNWQPPNQGAASPQVDDIGYPGNNVYHNQQNDSMLVGIHRTISNFEPQYEHGPPIHQYANAGTSPDQSQWSGANVQHGDALASQLLSPNVLEHNGGMSSRSPPWNPMDLRGQGEVRATLFFVDSATKPIRDPYEEYNSTSTLSSTMPSTAPPGSRCHDMSDSMMTIRSRLTPMNLDRLGHKPCEYSSHSLPPGGERRDAARSKACSDRIGSHGIEVGGGSRPQRFPTNTDTASSLGVPDQSIASSEVLFCPVVGCTKEFRGKCRRGTRSRHIRLKHTYGQEEKAYHCEVPGCSKVYCRQDARLKHYRKRHGDVMQVAAPKPRK